MSEKNRAVAGEPIEVDFTDEEYDIVEQAALELGMTVEEYIKDSGVKAAQAIISASRIGSSKT